MGLSFSCPFVESGDVENELESVVVKSISFGDDKVKTPVRTVSFKRQDSIPKILSSLGSGKMIMEGSVRFKGRGDVMISINPSSLDKENNVPIAPIKTMSNDVNDRSPRSDSPSGTCQPLPLEPSYPEHEAATRLQKVYKSFRTRRKLADCAVLVEQSWWKLLDFAELNRISVSFFDITKHESAISRWSRARKMAAKVGKGLSKNNKAQKMALQHWLEAIDPRHRYGHNLHLYYVKWLECQSRETFFYWLDIGEGKEVVCHKCPRLILQQQCIKYLGPMERKAYEVIIDDGKFLYKQTGEFLHTTRDAKWIFVLSASKILYAGKKKKGTFQHSSFLAGGTTTAAGRLVVENGILKAVWPHSGHYCPTEENFRDFISFLKENNVDLTYVQLTSIDEEEDSTSSQQSGNHFRSNSAEYFSDNLNVTETEVVNVEDMTQESIELIKQEYAAASKLSKSRQFRNLSRKLTDLEIPKEDGFIDRLQNENSAAGPSCANGVVDSPVGNGYETAEEAYTSDQEYMSLEQNSFEGYEAEVENVPEESILRRINSKKGTKSYQLGKQLSCKWSTGAGPRIGCVRDYPSELQLRALEQVNLSPRSTRSCRAYSSPRNSSGLSPKISSILSHCIGAVAETTDSSVPEMGSLNECRTQSSPLQRNGSITGC